VVGFLEDKQIELAADGSGIAKMRIGRQGRGRRSYEVGEARELGCQGTAGGFQELGPFTGEGAARLIIPAVLLPSFLGSPYGLGRLGRGMQRVLLDLPAQVAPKNFVLLDFVSMLIEDGQQFSLAGSDFNLQARLNLGGVFLLGKSVCFSQVLQAFAPVLDGRLQLPLPRLQLTKLADDVALASRFPPPWRPPPPLMFGGGQRLDDRDLLIQLGKLAALLVAPALDGGGLRDQLGQLLFTGAL